MFSTRKIAQVLVNKAKGSPIPNRTVHENFGWPDMTRREYLRRSRRNRTHCFSRATTHACSRVRQNVNFKIKPPLRPQTKTSIGVTENPTEHHIFGYLDSKFFERYNYRACVVAGLTVRLHPSKQASARHIVWCVAVLRDKKMNCNQLDPFQRFGRVLVGSTGRINV